MDEQTRRDLFRLPLAAGALSLAAQNLARGAAKPSKVIDEFDAANIKLAHRVSIRASDDDLLFLKQIGLRYIRAEIPLDAKLEELAPAKDRFARAGISIISCAHYAHRSLNIGLARPGPEREKDIETCKAVVRELGRLGVSILVLDWHPANVYTSSFVETKRGYKAREFSVSDFQSKLEKQRFDREYPAEEIWDGFVYWLKAVLPVAEEANVKLAMHPDDPPVLKKMNGIGRIFINEECYRRAEQLAGKSRHWGVRLCVGTWSEGGDQMGKDVFEMIRDYGGRGKIFDVDFRNVSSPLPRFNETLPDEGYLNLYQVMKALRQVRYSGPMVPDHIPPLVGDQGVGRGGLGYCIGFMRALLRAANEEVG